MEFIVSYFSKCAVSCVLSFCFPLGSERVSARALSLSVVFSYSSNKIMPYFVDDIAIWLDILCHTLV